MKLIKFLSAAIILTFVLASCNKEQMTTVVDNTPEVEVIDETVEVSQFRIGGAELSVNEPTLVLYKNEGEEGYHQYSIDLTSAETGVTAPIFSASWEPEMLEANIQEGTYSDEQSTALSITQDGLDIILAWLDAGSDPDNQPDIDEDDLVFYNAYDVTYTISNITETHADIVIAGEIVDGENTFEVSGSFTAELYVAEY